MTILTLPLSETLHDELKSWAERENVSVEELATSALEEKLSSLQQLAYFQERAKRGSREKFLAALSKVPDVPPVSPDEPVP